MFKPNVFQTEMIELSKIDQYGSHFVAVAANPHLIDPPVMINATAGHQTWCQFATNKGTCDCRQMTEPRMSE